jgi:hypothetical protein
MLRHVVKHMANRDDIAEIRNDMARKEQIIALHTQINSIETDLRGMKRDKLVTRVADLEDEVFGKSRATRVRVCWDALSREVRQGPTSILSVPRR